MTVDHPGGGEDGWCIQQAVIVDAAPEAVWQWIGTPARLSRWWCPLPTVRIRFEPTEDGHYQESYDDGDDRYDLTGTVIDYTPKERLTIERETSGRFGPTDRVSLSLSSTANGTRVVLVHTFKDLPATRQNDAETFFAEPWSESLLQLQRLVEGQE